MPIELMSCSPIWMLPIPSLDEMPTALQDGTEHRTEAPDVVMLVDTVDPGDPKHDIFECDNLEATANTAEGHRDLVAVAEGEGTVRESGNSGLSGRRVKRPEKSEQDRKSEISGLTQEKEMLFEVAGLLVDACSSMLEARKMPEEGEIVDVIAGIPDDIRNALYTYRPSGPLVSILNDDHKSKVEEAWDELQTYVNALIKWVQDTRSTTLIPLQRFRQLQSITDSTTTRRRFGSASEAVAHAEDRLEEMEDKFETLLAWKGCIDRMWRNCKALNDVECRAREMIREKSNQVQYIRESALARLARIQAIHDAEAPQLDHIQRQLRAMEAKAAPIEEHRDLCYHLRDAAIAAAPQGGQSLISGSALMIGKQMGQVSAESVDAILNDVVDLVEERLRPAIQVLDALELSSPAKPLGSSAGEATPASLAFGDVEGK